MRHRINSNTTGNFIAIENNIKIYFNEIKRNSLLTKEEEYETIRRAKEGYLKDFHKLIVANQLFVASCAKKFATNDNFLDLVNEGNIGMIEAFHKYDLNSDVRFLSYAVHYILRNIKNFLISNNLINKTNQSLTHYTIKKIKDDFFKENMRDPEIPEIQEILLEKYKITINDTNDLLDLKVGYISSNEEDGEEENHIFYEFERKYSTENDVNKFIEQNSIEVRLACLLGKLQPYEQEILKLAYGIDCDYPLTLNEIAKMFETEESVIQTIIEGCKCVR